MTQDLDNLRLLELLDKLLPKTAVEEFFDNLMAHPNDPPKSIRILGHRYDLVQDDQ